MRISYNKLWKLLIDKEISKMELKDAAVISTTTMVKLGRIKNVTSDILLKICKGLIAVPRIFSKRKWNNEEDKKCI